MTATDSQQSSQSALDMWNVQTQALANPALADAAIEAIYQNLMGLHEKLKASGNDKAAAKVEDAYNQALAIYNATTQQGVAIAVGAAAIEEAGQQRDQAMTELQQLIKAIEDGDEMHPKLAGYAEQIRQDEYESSMYDIVDDDYYTEIYDDNVTEEISQNWEVEGMQGTILYWGLTGHFRLNKKHARILQSLIREMPVSDADVRAYRDAVAQEPNEDAGGDE